MKNTLILISSFLLITMSSCETVNPEAKEAFEKNWQLVEFVWGDAVKLGCNNTNPDEEPMVTLEIESEQGTYKISGNGPVNTYFGTIESLSYDKASKSGKLTFGNLGVTRMAGSSLNMECETDFFKMLEAAKEFKITSDNRLLIGNFDEGDENTGDTDNPGLDSHDSYLVFASLEK